MAELGDVPFQAVGPVPKAFIKWAEFPKILEQGNTDGVKSTLLLKLDGSLLSLAGECEVQNMIGALVGNIWSSYEKGGASCGAERLYFMLIECENGKLAVTKIGQFLLCMYAEKKVEIGLLKQKVAAFSAYLEGPLGLVY